MQYQSTRNKSIAVSSAEAIKQGLSVDGGLFVPENIPSVTIDEIEAYTDQLLSSKPTLISVGAADCSAWYEAL